MDMRCPGPNRRQSSAVRRYVSGIREFDVTSVCQHISIVRCTKLTWASTGMYSRNAWGGPVDPYISLMFPPDKNAEGKKPLVSVVIFEWKDAGLIGFNENPDRPDSQVDAPLSWLRRPSRLSILQQLCLEAQGLTHIHSRQSAFARING